MRLKGAVNGESAPRTEFPRASSCSIIIIIIIILTARTLIAFIRFASRLGKPRNF